MSRPFSSSILPEDARAIFRAAVEAVHPGRAIRSRLSWDGNTLEIDHLSVVLKPSDRIWVVGAGKAGAPMVEAVENIFGDRIHDGAVVVPHGGVVPTRFVPLMPSGHPFPDRHGLAGSRAVKNLLSRTQSGDLVLCLLSGGASSLLPAPAGSIQLKDKIAVSRALMDAGADIIQLNTLRKHLSEFKGGGLVRLAAPARVLTLILSDVVDDRLDIIGSGPTAGDSSTFRDALEIVSRFLPQEKIPAAVIDHLRRGTEGKVPETVKPDDPILDNARNLIVGNVRTALEGARREAMRLGYRATVMSTRVTGEARLVGARYAAMAKRLKSFSRAKKPRCLLAGGETTVTVRGSGKGGRSQELALAAAMELTGVEGILVGAMGSDGVDGPTDAAGAVADGQTANRGRISGLDPLDCLERNDSYVFLKQAGSLLFTGPTGTNVMDLHLVLLA